MCAVLPDYRCETLTALAQTCFGEVERWAPTRDEPGYYPGLYLNRNDEADLRSRQEVARRGRVWGIASARRAVLRAGPNARATTARARGTCFGLYRRKPQSDGAPSRPRPGVTVGRMESLARETCSRPCESLCRFDDESPRRISACSAHCSGEWHKGRRSVGAHLLVQAHRRWSSRRSSSGDVADGPIGRHEGWLSWSVCVSSYLRRGARRSQRSSQRSVSTPRVFGVVGFVRNEQMAGMWKPAKPCSDIPCGLSVSGSAEDPRGVTRDNDSPWPEPRASEGRSQSWPPVRDDRGA